jgi:hypothetical protein
VKPADTEDGHLELDFEDRVSGSKKEAVLRKNASFVDSPIYKQVSRVKPETCLFTSHQRALSCFA